MRADPRRMDRCSGHSTNISGFIIYGNEGEGFRLFATKQVEDLVSGGEMGFY